MPIEFVAVPIQLELAVIVRVSRPAAPGGPKEVVLVPLTCPQVISASVPTTSLPSC